LIVLGSKCKKPKDLTPLFKPLVDSVKALQDFRNTKRGTDCFNHLSSLSEGIPMVFFVGNPTAKAHVDESFNAAEFYTNKLLVTFKNSGDSGKPHVEFVKKYKDLAKELAVYVKAHQTTGLAFNPKGVETSDYKSGSSSAPAQKKSGPPSGPPPPSKELSMPVKETTGGFNAGDLFSQINSLGNKEGGLGLRKVEKHEKTKYRDPNEKVEVVKAKTTSNKKKSRITGEGKMECAGDKWTVENYEGNTSIDVNIESVKQTVYIRKCDNSLINIKGKCNSVFMDDCQRSVLVFDTVVAACELVNCQRAKIHVNGNIPTIMVDKTDGLNIFLCETSLDTTLITSKSSEMNVSIPVGNDDFKEYPVPEQYVTVWDKANNKLDTQTNSHMG
jgi:adenylyl cyclase-associated protein